MPDKSSLNKRFSDVIGSVKYVEIIFKFWL